MIDKSELVSVGVPVFNGEDKILLTIESLINQDYTNIEIIISDNGSTDKTHSICRKLPSLDSRIKYFRSDINRGSIWNFNRVFMMSKGKYFMWAAHDDFHHKEFISACVKKLNEFPDAVLCQSHTKVCIEGKDDLICTNNLISFKNKLKVSERYRETLKNFPATAIYGLYRSDAIRKTKLFQKHIATDLSFIKELSIYGNFIETNKSLFTYFCRDKWNTIDQDYKVFYGIDKKPKLSFPFIIHFYENILRLINSNIPFLLKFHLALILINYEFRQILIKILIKSINLLLINNLKIKFGHIIYWKFIHNPNVIVGNAQLYLDRIVNPILRLK